MRADRYGRANNWTGLEWLNVRVECRSYNKSEHLLFSSTTLNERL